MRGINDVIRTQPHDKLLFICTPNNFSFSTLSSWVSLRVTFSILSCSGFGLARLFGLTSIYHTFFIDKVK